MKVVKSLDYEGQKWYIPVLKKVHLEVNYKVLFKALKDLKYISDMKYLKVQTQAYVTYYSLEHSLTHSRPALQNYALDSIMHQCFGSAAHGQCKNELREQWMSGVGMPQKNMFNLAV